MAKKEPPKPAPTRKVASKAVSAAQPRAVKKKPAAPAKKKKKVDTKPDTVVRAIAFPVACVAAGGTWQEFSQAMHTMWRASTRAANCVIQHYALADKVNVGDGPLPPFEYTNVYQALVRSFPELLTTTFSSICQSSGKAYLRYRTQFWNGARALPLFRYPAPFPVHNQAWKPVLVNGERPGVQFSMGSKRSKLTRWTLVFAGGPGFKRQLAHFRQLMDGTAKAGELTVYRQRCGSTHRNGTTEKSPGGASREHYRIMVKMVIRTPAPPKKEATGVLLLTTDPDVLWTARHDERVVSPWVLPGDEALSWLARMREASLTHAVMVRRMSQDLKVEKRTHVGQYAQHLGRLDKICEKHRRRVRTFLQQCAAGIVNYCRRRSIGTLVYDDTCKEWLPSFPWFQLRLELLARCQAHGITAGGTLLQASATDGETEEADNASE